MVSQGHVCGWIHALNTRPSLGRRRSDTGRAGNHHKTRGTNILDFIELAKALGAQSRDAVRAPELLLVPAGLQPPAQRSPGQSYPGTKPQAGLFLCYRRTEGGMLVPRLKPSPLPASRQRQAQGAGGPAPTLLPSSILAATPLLPPLFSAPARPASSAGHQEEEKNNDKSKMQVKIQGVAGGMEQSEDGRRKRRLAEPVKAHRSAASTGVAVSPTTAWGQPPSPCPVLPPASLPTANLRSPSSGPPHRLLRAQHGGNEKQIKPKERTKTPGKQRFQPGRAFFSLSFPARDEPGAGLSQL